MDVASRNPGKAKQVISSLIVSVSSLQTGMAVGWVSPMIVRLQQDDSPFGYMSTSEIATLISTATYTSLLFYFGYAFVADRFGRKTSLIASAIPTCVGNFIIAFSSDTISLYVGKVIALTALVGISTSMMYVSETVHKSIRGILASNCSMQMNFGILLSYILGAGLSFRWFNIVMGIIPGISAVVLSWLPETPYFLAEKGRYEEAKKSLLWFRGGDIQVAEQELETIRNTPSVRNLEENHTFWEILKTALISIAFEVSLLTYTFEGLSGMVFLFNYAGIVFDEAGSPLGSNESTILTGILNIFASFSNLFLIDRVGRKPLLYITFVGGSLLLGTFSALQFLDMKGVYINHLNWISLSCLYLYILVQGIGVSSVPGVLMSEISPTTVKPIISTIVCALSAMLAGALIQVFPYMNDNIGLYSCFTLSTISNIIGLAYTFFRVPETKGKSLTQIFQDLGKSTPQLK